MTMDALDHEWLYSLYKWERWERCREWVCQWPTFEAYATKWASQESKDPDSPELGHKTPEDLDRDQVMYLMDWWEWAHISEPGSRPPGPAVDSGQ